MLQNGTKRIMSGIISFTLLLKAWVLWQWESEACIGLLHSLSIEYFMLLRLVSWYHLLL